MRVLLTGHNGYIGTILGPMLLKHGHDVIGLDTDLYQRCTFSGSVPQIEAITIDVRDIQIDDIIGFEAIICLIKVKQSYYKNK